MSDLVIRNKEDHYDAQYAREDADKAIDVIGIVNNYLKDIRIAAEKGEYEFIAYKKGTLPHAFRPPVIQKLRYLGFNVSFDVEKMTISW